MSEARTLTPVHATVLEHNHSRIYEYVPTTDARFWVQWPKPGDNELVYWTITDLPPARREILRGPRFEGNDTFIAEVREVKESGRVCVAMIRFDRCDESVDYRDGEPVWHFSDPQEANERWEAEKNER